MNLRFLRVWLRVGESQRVVQFVIEKETLISLLNVNAL